MYIHILHIHVIMSIILDVRNKLWCLRLQKSIPPCLDVVPTLGAGKLFQSPCGGVKKTTKTA